MTKLIATTFSLLYLCLATIAQTNAVIITGTVIDKSTALPVELATVTLVLTTDSSVNLSAVTDKKGNFKLETSASGNYKLICTYSGFTCTTRTIKIRALSPVNAGVIELSASPTTMKEVVITSIKALLNTSIDRKSYDVTKDIMAQSGTASDILKNIPSVEVDLEGNVSLRGSGDVIILINGRPSPLFGKLNKAEVLQQFPANTIERIEVITNPSARYRPDGTTGIINIILKKNIKGGLNGSITANAGNRDRYNANATLNYNPGKLNLFSNFGIRKDARLRTNKVSREYFDPTTHDNSGYYTEDGESFARPLTQLIALGFTYNPDKSNSFGLSGNYSNRKQIRTERNTKIFSDENHTYTSYFDRLRYDPESEIEKDATAFYEHKFPGEDHTIRAELNVASSKDQEDNHYQNRYHYPGNNSTFDNTGIFQGDNQQQFTVDYSRTISESEKLETGYSGSFNQQDFNFYGEYFDFIANKFVVDHIKTNQFLFDQSIHAFYGTYEKKYRKFGYSVGLRLEESIIKGRQVTKDTTINNDYLKLYPTLHLAYALNESSQLQLNYSRRVHRPEGDDINPFPEYQDPYNVRTGNAKLLPEIIHSVELGYKWQDKNFSLVPGIYYRYKQNGFTQITIPLSDSVLLTTIENLSNDQSLGLELIFSAKAGKFFSSNLSTNLFYNQIQATNLGYFDKKNIVSFSTNFNSTFTITPNTMAQVSAIYYSPRVIPQGKRYPTFVLNAGIRQDLFKKRISLTLTASDILRTLLQKTELNTSYLNQLATGRRDGQIVYLGISCRFGKTVKKQEEKMQFENGN